MKYTCNYEIVEAHRFDSWFIQEAEEFINDKLVVNETVSYNGTELFDGDYLVKIDDHIICMKEEVFDALYSKCWSR